MDKLANYLPVGTVFANDFRILYKIGEGGMGVVYAAEQVSTSKVRALKLMHTALLHDAAMRERFLHEAHVSAQIESDHIVEVVAAGIDPASGAPWIAMELLRGETLEQRVKEHGPLSASDLLELATQLRHVLSRAHAAGIVHRDLKPENLFIRQARRVGIPFTLKVLDFGIAKWVQESRSATNSQVLGSPLWMAPEQWKPKAPITAATDVWALGLVMFFALTGRPYWRTASGDDVGRVIVEVVADPLVPPSQRSRELGLKLEVPPGFDAWFLACITRDPAQRLPDADSALEQFIELFDGPRRSVRTVNFRDTGPITVNIPPALAPSTRRFVPPPMTGPITPTQDNAAEIVWALVSTPLAAHSGVHRVLTDLTPAIVEALAVEPVLVGLTEDLRIDSMSARTATAERSRYDGLSAMLTTIARKLGLKRPPLYVRPTQYEPVRIEPCEPLACVLAPSLTQVTPAAAVFLAAIAAAVSRPELRLRAIAADVPQLRRIIATATDIARQRTVKGPRDMIASIVRGRVMSTPQLAASLQAFGDECSEPALAAWLVAVDTTLARVGLLASGRLAAAAEALAGPPVMSTPTTVDSVLADLDEWIATESHARARTVWGTPMSGNTFMA
jgi:serine/threonine protein kinase